MHSNNGGMQMDQKIFELGLSVEVVSVYLLCTGLADSGQELIFETIRSLWNGTDEELLAGLAELEKKRIIGVDSNHNVTEIMKPELWRV